jgi:hypothetical protein
MEMELTEKLAVYAASLSTLLAIVGVYRYWRERRPKFRFRIDELQKLEALKQITLDHSLNFKFGIVNQSDRNWFIQEPFPLFTPVKDHFSADYRTLHFDNAFPFKMEPGSEMSAHFPTSYINELRHAGVKFVQICFYDTHGKLFKSKKIKMGATTAARSSA